MQQVKGLFGLLELNHVRVTGGYRPHGSLQSPVPPLNHPGLLRYQHTRISPFTDVVLIYAEVMRCTISLAYGSQIVSTPANERPQTMSNYTPLTAPVATTNLPKGIPYIIGNEAAERFSFYGMKAILTIFMTKYLFLLSDTAGTPMPKAEAIARYHDFTFWVYLTPVFGAYIADRFLGKYRTILSLSIVYCLGHFALAFMGSGGLSAENWMLTGLYLIAIGSGGIKPCVSAHVGDQFGKSNGHWLTKVFGWFYISINVGAAFSTLATPLLLLYSCTLLKK